MKIDLIAGARPNFVKIAAIITAIRNSTQSFNFRLIHTGQHYDHNMSGNFFTDLNIPLPDFNLEAGSGSQAEQTASIMIGYEKLLNSFKPDICIVVGDVTSSMACAITAKKQNIELAHIEAGIRSGDMSMPEEINRIIIDSISDYFFTTSRDATENLIRAGHHKETIFFVGNTMIDTLLMHKPQFRPPEIWHELKLEKKQYVILTLHRPDNVDEISKLSRTLQTIEENSRGLPIIFPAHPRTAKIIQSQKPNSKNLHFTPPLGYLEFNFLVINSKLVITDSGGITEETTVLNVPCITLRDNTERPETVTIGTNELAGSNPENLPFYLKKLFDGKWKPGQIPEFWDGNAGKRIVEVLGRLYFAFIF
ncbi:non-hydrolyzing UDP-N-acetylglucosamine 2-epimerase [Christiangramia portivictoriae]|uniref:non-hydrolyzing UDP-N-acetylglucosamine 2-epimerase n=1 Tax=Christiangramia portivictoriae TaxID=326069 RepID=UPI000479B877|nr:UDP-N-acetylglucosamine 2-epimerase (non-hydrolyzing) [Christiangramia portivictoriae]